MVHRNDVLEQQYEQLKHISTLNNNLKEQIDTLSLRAVDIEQNAEIDKAHYKGVIRGLQSNVLEAERCSSFMETIENTIMYYKNGEQLESMQKVTERKCSVCMSSSANVVCKPCRHLEYCVKCAEKLNNTNIDQNGCIHVNGEFECPRCRADISILETIFT
jgi:hypothetical protein